MAFRELPTTSYNKSKGTIYPLIGRMMERGLVTSTKAEAGGGETLSLAERGYEALNRWLIDGPTHSFGHDPLLDRMMVLGGVAHAQRVRWIAGAKELLLAKKDELKAYRLTVDAPYIDIAHGSAVAVIDAKLEWLDRLLIEIVKNPDG